MATSDGFGNTLIAVRILQALTLIPCWATLAALVAVYANNNAIILTKILCPFIFSLLASIWAFCALIAQIRAHNTALWMAFGDVLLMAALIAGAPLLSNVTTTMQCTGYLMQVTVIYDRVTGAEVWRSQDLNGDSSYCRLAKAAFALDIVNIILFFISAILSTVVYQQNKIEDEEIAREEIYNRRGIVGRPPSHRRHRYRHRDPRTGEHIIEERTE